MAQNEFTKKELGAWKQHPEAFFGQLEDKHDEPTNWLELAEFFYRTYRTTSKERLTEFMASHDDIGELAALNQGELAIVYCERMGWSAWSETYKRQTTLDPDASKDGC